MKVDFARFLDDFNQVLDHIQHDKKDVFEINKYLSNFNIMVGTFNEYLNNRDKLQECDPDLLCLFACAITEVKGKEFFNCNNYYNESEIRVAKRYQGNIEKEDPYPVVFENVIRSSEQDYITTIHIKKAYELLKNVLNYNYDTQRAPQERKRKDGTIIQKPYVNQKSVSEICELMLRNKYKPDTVTYNILFDGTDEIEYDEETKTLTVYSGQIDILDGFHRHQGLARALEQNPNLDLHLNVEIKNYSLEDAQWYYAQKNTINLPDRATTRKMKNLTYSDMIVNELEKRSETLQGKISNKSRVAHSIGYLTNFTIVSEAIDEIFKPQNRKDVLDISRFLAEFFDYFIHSYEEFKNVSETSKENWIVHPYMFYGYIYLAKKFYDQNISVTKITECIDQISFKKGQSKFDQIIDFKTNKGSKVKQEIIKVFEGVKING